MGTEKKTWDLSLYAVKAQTSLAPLSRFCGSHITTAHAHQCCRFQSYCEEPKTACRRVWNWQAKLTKREPHSWDPRQQTTWSRPVTFDFNSVLGPKNIQQSCIYHIRALVKISMALNGASTMLNNVFNINLCETPPRKSLVPNSLLVFTATNMHLPRYTVVFHQQDQRPDGLRLETQLALTVPLQLQIPGGQLLDEVLGSSCKN